MREFGVSMAQLTPPRQAIIEGFAFGLFSAVEVKRNVDISPESLLFSVMTKYESQLGERIPTMEWFHLTWMVLWALLIIAPFLTIVLSEDRAVLILLFLGSGICAFLFIFFSLN